MAWIWSTKADYVDGKFSRAIFALQLPSTRDGTAFNTEFQACVDRAKTANLDRLEARRKKVEEENDGGEKKDDGEKKEDESGEEDSDSDEEVSHVIWEKLK